MKRTFLSEFREARHVFDKKLKYYDRKRSIEKSILLDTNFYNSPKQFWNYIKKLGPKVPKTIPVKVFDTDLNDYNTDPKFVLDKWRNDFESLYNSNSVDYDVEFYREKMDIE